MKHNYRLLNFITFMFLVYSGPKKGSVYTTGSATSAFNSNISLEYFNEKSKLYLGFEIDPAHIFTRFTIKDNHIFYHEISLTCVKSLVKDTMRDEVPDWYFKISNQNLYSVSNSRICGVHPHLSREIIDQYNQLPSKVFKKVKLAERKHNLKTLLDEKN